ncbi:MAG: sugar phosphate isomerase/epimerase [Candidatus Hydrogenedentes bacterium]|nr:sugar phosphate isomerase/epimerase [Candidatus Hydrogenedentota bacterium]
MKKPLVCAFSKHLQFLDYAALAKKSKELGLDGLDLTVRKGGHVEPANVARDLPRAVEAICAEGLEVPMITTNLHRGDDPDARPILEAASRLGIPYFRIGGQNYAKDAHPADQLRTFTEEVRSLIGLAEEFNMTAGYHNHSGYDNVGAPLWDLYLMIRDVGSSRLGSNLDMAHAAIEGAYGAWEINARLLAPYVKMMAAKDFVWDGDKPRWVPLGTGIVKSAAFLKILREADFHGPISMHYEYDIKSHDEMLEEVRKSALTLRAELQRAGYE